MDEGDELPNLDFLVEAEEWMESGVCRVEHADPNIFILARGHNASEAQSYCNRCPHRKECFEYGKRTRSVGVWGGEVLGQSNQDSVVLRPLVLLTDARPVEHLLSPPAIQDHQNPLSLFG